MFFYMPLQHCEAREVQDESVAAYRRLVMEAPEALKRHSSSRHSNTPSGTRRDCAVWAVPAPERMLGRASTPEESLHRAGGGLQQLASVSSARLHRSRPEVLHDGSCTGTRGDERYQLCACSRPGTERSCSPPRLQAQLQRRRCPTRHGASNAISLCICSYSALRLRRIRRRQHHFELHELIARRIAGQPTPSQPQLLAGLRARRNAHLHRPTQRRHRAPWHRARLPTAPRATSP